MMKLKICNKEFTSLEDASKELNIPLEIIYKRLNEGKTLNEAFQPAVVIYGNLNYTNNTTFGEIKKLGILYGENYTSSAPIKKEDNSKEEEVKKLLNQKFTLTLVNGTKNCTFKSMYELCNKFHFDPVKMKTFFIKSKYDRSLTYKKLYLDKNKDNFNEKNTIYLNNILYTNSDYFINSNPEYSFYKEEIEIFLNKNIGWEEFFKYYNLMKSFNNIKRVGSNSPKVIFKSKISYMTEILKDLEICRKTFQDWRKTLIIEKDYRFEDYINLFFYERKNKREKVTDPLSGKKYNSLRALAEARKIEYVTLYHRIAYQKLSLEEAILKGSGNKCAPRTGKFDVEIFGKTYYSLKDFCKKHKINYSSFMLFKRKHGIDDTLEEIVKKYHEKHDFDF